VLPQLFYAYLGAARNTSVQPSALLARKTENPVTRLPATPNDSIIFITSAYQDVDFHRYFDDGSGDLGLCEPWRVFSPALSNSTTLMRQTGHRGTLTEFGGSPFL